MTQQQTTDPGEKKKICPLASITSPGYDNGCQRELCAFWVAWQGMEACAVTALALVAMDSHPQRWDEK